LILKIVKVLCFHTLLQVLILKGVRRRHNSCGKRALHCLCIVVEPCAGMPLLGDDPVAEKKKRERAPAVKAQILTRLMIAEGYRVSQTKLRGVVKSCGN
jgi:hypothetical protein